MNNKIDELIKLFREFDNITSDIIDILDDVLYTDDVFTEIFSSEYDFDKSYDDELIKHKVFLYDVLRKYMKKKYNKDI